MQVDRPDLDALRALRTYHRYVNVRESGAIMLCGPVLARKTVVRPPRQVALTKNERKRLIVRKGIRQPVAHIRMVC